MTKRNENRPEYKKTKVGWIPEEWGIKKGDEISTLITKGSSPKWQGFTYQNNGVLFITSENVRNGFLDISIQKYLPKEFNEKQRSSILRYGDILINIVGASIGRACKYHLSDTSANINQAVCLLRPNKEVDSNFISYYLQHPLAVRRLLSAQVDSARPNLTLSNIRTFCFVVPPLSEQKKIAEILSAWDRAVEQAGRLIDAKQRLKKGLMQQLLTGRMRFPEFGPTNKRVKAHFYDFSSDWKHPQISEIASEVSERDRELINYPVLSCSKYDGFVNSLEYFGKKVYSNDTSNYKLIKQGQFGFPSNHIEEGSIGLLHHIGAGIVSPIYTVFEVNLKKVFAPYLYALFKTDTYQHVFNVNTNSSVDRRGSLRWKEFSKIRVPLPSVEEQTRIAAVLSTCDREIELLCKKQAALREQKKGLMQKLLTGEMRVKL